jgi:hypothetical protein
MWIPQAWTDKCLEDLKSNKFHVLFSGWKSRRVSDIEILTMEEDAVSKTVIFLNCQKSVSYGVDRIRKSLCLCQLACWPSQTSLQLKKIIPSSKPVQEHLQRNPINWSQCSETVIIGRYWYQWNLFSKTLCKIASIWTWIFITGYVQTSMFRWSCISIYLCNKTQLDPLFTPVFFLSISLFKFLAYL